MSVISDSEEPDCMLFNEGTELKNSEILKKNQLNQIKKNVKAVRKKVHERNISQKNEKKRKYNELESQRLSLDFLNSLAQSSEINETENDFNHPTKYQNLKSRKKTKRRQKKEITKLPAISVKPLQMHLDDKAEILKKKANDFKKNCLYNKKIPRIKSEELRLLNEKLKNSGKDKM